MAQQVNAAYREIVARDLLVHYADVATPLLNNRGNAIWGATIKAALMPMEARAEKPARTTARR